MPVPQTMTSGLIQNVTSGLSNSLSQWFPFAQGELASGDVMRAMKDSASPYAIPAVPTTEAPYDGAVAFGIFACDEGADA